MKKTTIALLALASFSLAHAADEFTLDSEFVLADGTTFSAFDDVVGKTSSQVGANDYVSAGWAHTNGATTTLTLNLGDMYSAEALSGTLSISTVTLVSRPKTDDQTNGTVSLVIDGQTYTSENAVFDVNSSTYGTVTFASPVEVSADASITLNITATPVSDSLGYGEFRADNGASLNGFSGSYTPVVRLTGTVATPAVPEPATATLSLLALAGLAARRRRR